MISILLMIALPCVALGLLIKAGPNIKWAKLVAILCILLCLALAIARIVKSSAEGQAKQTLSVNEQYQNLLGGELAQFLNTDHAGAKITILSPPVPFTYQAKAPQTVSESLQEVLTEAGFVVTSHLMEVPDEAIARFQKQVDPATDPNIILDTLINDPSLWLSPQAFSNLLKQLGSEADVVICTVPFVLGIERQRLPAPDQQPKIILLNSFLSNASFAEAFEDSSLIAAVLNQPTSNAWIPIPKHPAEAFKKRYILVTKQNVSSLAGTHPLL